MLYDEINYILYTRKPVKILDLNGFIIYSLYYSINRLLSKNYVCNFASDVHVRIQHLCTVV